MSTVADHIEEEFEEKKGVFSRFIEKHVLKQPESYLKKKKNYVFGKTLGAGSFGVVRRARKLHPREDVAIKILIKDALSPESTQMLYDELQILESCHHPNIVAFKDWFESRDKFFIVTQLAVGGELFDRIIKRGSFSEADAILIIKQILAALQYLHARDIVHRDLKPENILYLYKDGEDEEKDTIFHDRKLDEEEANRIVIADFGIAKKLEHPEDLIFKGAGSMGYVAPEVLMQKGHGKPCDIWSLGVITYTLLCGYSPFMAESVDGFLEEISSGPEPVVFHAPYWNQISTEAKTFITKCCTIDPGFRPSAEELLKDDPWIKLFDQKAEKVTREDLLPQIKKSFNAKLKLQHAIQIVLLNNKIKKLKEKYGIVSEDSDLDNSQEVNNTNGESQGSSEGTTEASRASTPLQESMGNANKQAIDVLKKQLQELSLKNDEKSKHLKSDITQAAFANLVQFATLQKDVILKEQEEESQREANHESEK